jgi:hypothetical protein
MSIQTNGPRDIVEGGPERPPNGQDQSDQTQPEHTGKRGAAQKDERDQRDRKQAPHQGDDDVSYQPESGQVGAD